MRPRALQLLVIALLLAAPAVAQAARILPPGPESSFGRAEIDLNASGRVAVAYERTVPGPDVIRVAIRAASRLTTPTVGRRIGRGALRMVRLGDAPGDRHVVVWRRAGETVVSVWTGATWRTERLPAGARRLEALAGAVVGRRVLLVVGTGSQAVAVTRAASGGWRAAPLPASGGPRAKLVAAASKPSGRVVVAWSQAAAGGRAIEAASFALATGRWTTPAVAVPAGAVAAAVVNELTLNSAGDAVLSAVTQSGSGVASATPAAYVLRHDAAAWSPLPPPAPYPADAPQLALTPAGVPVRAWREGDEIRFSQLSADGLSWGTPEVAWKRPADDFGELYAVDDLAVDDTGRVVASVAVDPGPGPDDHFFLVRPAPAGPFGAPRAFASLYGPPSLVVGGGRVAASWVQDASLGGLPEAVLAPG